MLLFVVEPDHDHLLSTLHRSLASSANLESLIFTPLSKSFMQLMNNNGPSTDP